MFEVPGVDGFAVVVVQAEHLADRSGIDGLALHDIADVGEVDVGEVVLERPDFMRGERTEHLLGRVSPVRFGPGKGRYSVCGVERERGKERHSQTTPSLSRSSMYG